MANINKAQVMRPSLSDVIDFLNDDYQEEIDGIHSDISKEVTRAKAAEEEIVSNLEQSISDNIDSLMEGLTEQPDFDALFTNTITGVTLTVTNGVRIGALVSFNLNITTDSNNSVVQNTKIADVADWFNGVSLATSFKNTVIEVSSANGLKSNTAMTTNTSYDFKVVGVYNKQN